MTRPTKGKIVKAVEVEGIVFWTVARIFGHLPVMVSREIAQEWANRHMKKDGRTYIAVPFFMPKLSPNKSLPPHQTTKKKK